MNQTQAFRVLASADRQLVLHELVANDGQATIEDLSRQVAARRHRVAPEKITDTKVERARVRLVHTHFPALIDSNAIAVDWNDSHVLLTEGEDTDQLFAAADELESWPPTDLLDQAI